MEDRTSLDSEEGLGLDRRVVGDDISLFGRFGASAAVIGECYLTCEHPSTRHLPRRRGCYCRHHAIYAANVMSPAKSVVSVFSPVLTPRVLYDPIRLVSEPEDRKSSGPVTDEKHAMRPAANEISHDLILIKRYVCEVCDANGDLVFVELALPLLSSVRVRSLLFQSTRLHQVAVGVRHEPAVAPVVALVFLHSIALNYIYTYVGIRIRRRSDGKRKRETWDYCMVTVNELLLAEAQELPSCCKVRAFHRSCSRGEALHVRLRRGRVPVPLPLPRPEAREPRLELVLGEVGEGRDPVLRGGVQDLVLRRADHVPREHPQPVSVLRPVPVLLPVPPHERLELRLRAP
ncbi:hypothetical protein ACMD2_06644 [Ananas comosus]|uniref:Uncharacterized protein n=1 Tax=Ananas comosus TaxID=4615 RepID=A0A199UFG0_ANACO|nr:hypothetical protein ACMD2_06644 [Ananas comosus]